MAKVKSKSVGVTLGGVLAKLIALIFVPVILGLTLVYWLITFIIDSIATARESKVLSEKNAKLKSIERSRERQKNSLDFFFGYIKNIF